ncbi:MAG TPA: hypothetical protein PLI62_18825 [Spirochaetota bacterium]|nr:hypothetical protein [Spirochaetota bacterium]
MIGSTKKTSAIGRVPFLTGVVFGILLTLVTGFFIFLILDFGKGMGPQVYTDNEVRTRVEGFFGVKIPPVAGKLYYREEGFQDSQCYIALSLPPEDAWKLIRTYTGKEQSDFKALRHDTNTGYDLNEPGTWSLGSLKSPVVNEIVKNNTCRIVIYDKDTRRLLVYFSSW